MSLADLLRKEARQIAEALKRGLSGVIDEERHIDRSQPESWHAERLAFLAKERHAGLSGPARLAAYKPDTTKHPDCPYCWMLEGRQMALVPDLASPGTIACSHCGGRYIEWL